MHDVDTPRTATIVVALATLVACDGGADDPAAVWLVEVTGATDACHPEPVPYEGPREFEYELRFDGVNVSLAIDDERFANGAISGCTIRYQTVVWTDVREDGQEIRWQLSGEATHRPGGEECGLDEGVDWLGTETFEIIASGDPTVPAGCNYDLDMSGVYLGQSE